MNTKLIRTISIKGIPREIRWIRNRKEYFKSRPEILKKMFHFNNEMNQTCGDIFDRTITITVYGFGLLYMG